MTAGKPGDCDRRRRPQPAGGWGFVSDPFVATLIGTRGRLQGLIDRRLGQISHRRAPVDEVMALTRPIELGTRAGVLSTTTPGTGGGRGDAATLCEAPLQKAQLVLKAPKRGAHRKRRERAPLPGMLLPPGWESAAVGAGSEVGSDRHDG